MVGKLTGKVAHKGVGWAIVDVGGVGYKVFTDTSSLKENQKAELFIHHHIREDKSDLYGFASLDDLIFFELLLMVPGVGPKVAQAILFKISAGKLRQTLSTGEIALLETVAGVGRKLAQKIAVELRPKLAYGQFELSSLEAENDVIEGLKSLGYTSLEISRALRELPEGLSDSSQKIRWCLKFLGKKH